MALILGKKKTAPVAPSNEVEHATKPTVVTPPTQPQTHAPVKTKGPGLSFIKKGSEAQKILAQQEAKAALLKSQVRRYWIPKGKTTKGTFLDGAVKDGMLDITYFHQHTVFMNGNYNNWFICTADDEPCPVCEGGDSPEYVGALTIVDHGEFTSKQDGKTYKDQVRLFIAKRSTLALLLKRATAKQAMGSLAGCTFEISRSTAPKSPAVGDDFVFEDRQSVAKVISTYSTKENAVAPLNMEEVLKAMYLSADQLRKLGFGDQKAPIGSEPPPEEYDNMV